jgi:ABC-2 type transport system ATP-binding protein
MIAVDRLTKSYGTKEVLRGMTFRADPCAITLLVGPNGAGKSTTLKVLAGLIRPSSGLVRVNGFDVMADRIKAQSRLAYMPQSPSFHPRLNCVEVLRFYARLRGVAVARCEAMLELTGLSDVAHVRTGKLSGGMRQRLGLALLLLADAPILLLDEPGLSLDPAWRKRLQETLHFEAQRGKTVLITTHLIAEWNNVADRCLLCRNGAIERELDPTDLPQNFDAPDARNQSLTGPVQDEPRHFAIH